MGKKANIPLMNIDNIDENFTRIVAWVLFEIQKENLATDPTQLVNFNFQSSNNNKEIPSNTDQERAVRFLGKEGAFVIKDRIFLPPGLDEYTARMLGIKHSGVWLKIQQPKFNSLLESNSKFIKKTSGRKIKMPENIDRPTELTYKQFADIKINSNFDYHINKTDGKYGALNSDDRKAVRAIVVLMENSDTSVSFDSYESFAKKYKKLMEHEHLRIKKITDMRRFGSSIISRTRSFLKKHTSKCYIPTEAPFRLIAE